MGWVSLLVRFLLVFPKLAGMLTLVLDSYDKEYRRRKHLELERDIDEWVHSDDTSESDT